jgi:tRNA pseudouridine55 synthase
MPCSPFIRHPELVSGPIVPNGPKLRGEKWALKQVQGDEKKIAALLRIPSPH